MASTEEGKTPTGEAKKRREQPTGKVRRVEEFQPGGSSGTSGGEISNQGATMESSSAGAMKRTPTSEKRQSSEVQEKKQGSSSRTGTAGVR